MDTLTLASQDVLRLARAGDRVVAIDGHRLASAKEVAALEPKSLLLVNDIPGGQSEHRLYPDNVESIEVERGKPEPKPQRRRFGSLTLWTVGGGEWKSEDNRHGVTYQQAGITYCEAPHPVRITAQMIEDARERPFSGDSRIVLWAVQSGKRGYYCPGEQEHPGDWAWIPWSQDARVDHRAHSVYATLAEAGQALADALAQVEEA